METHGTAKRDQILFGPSVLGGGDIVGKKEGGLVPLSLPGCSGVTLGLDRSSYDRSGTTPGGGCFATSAVGEVMLAVV